MGMPAWEVGRSECRAVMARIRVSRSPGTKVRPRPTGLSWQESLTNRLYEERQMTTRTASVLGASSASGTPWDAINWRPMERQVRRLQMRIAKAVREGRWGKVKALQWLLTHSFSAKLLAVKRVVHNPGRRTPGVDRVVWRTAAQKMRAARSLKRRGYHPQPLRRLYIPKKSGNLRRPFNTHHVGPSDASASLARPRAGGGNESGSELLWVSPISFHRRCHDAMLHGVSPEAVCSMDTRRRYQSVF